MTREKAPSPEGTPSESAAVQALVRGERELFDLFHSQQEPDEQEILVVSQAITLCGLPYRRLMEPVFDRQGRPVLDSRGRQRSRPVAHYERVARTARGPLRVIYSSSLPDVSIPYGQDRAVLAWSTSKLFLRWPREHRRELARNSRILERDRTITWRDANEFFDDFGLSKSGSDYARLWERWRRLCALNIVIERPVAGHLLGEQRVLLERWDLPLRGQASLEADGQRRLDPDSRYSICFSETVVRDLLEYYIPLPLPLMRRFKDEPKAWDFAAYVYYRSWICQVAQRYGRPGIARVSWEDLSSQLGSVDRNDRRLRTTLSSILRTLSSVWPEHRARFSGSTLVIEAPRGGHVLVLPRR